ncbi:DNA-processing protein DprA [Longimicrobium terrae]|uniref:DNA processing protein n=1 Tax=Longimicrobium terrae TaxID=1639882 RepID=A0A841GVX5_9BACT|nr:DNA-processing protein DprA [Longimicrobium terrae]MBB4635624.1 DNA processing protein [Longimicrobium terrae]MBB6070018.1 DNA processing protein [Longimicrobium terrae]NNC32928.1 DNA-protecting protein DprA [Longimicrobium terrae]
MKTTSDAYELLCVLQWPKIGPATALDLLRRKKAEDSVLEAAEQRFPGVDAAQRQVARDRAEQIIERCSDLGLAVLGYDDASFPVRLRTIPDVPAIIYVRGDPGVLHYPSLAVVGTRQVSSAGARAAELIARFLARRSFNVVSGLALGVDMHAHVGALEANGITTAVLAHGLDRVAPSSHRALAERIVDSGGALVSEHPPGVPPRPAEFVRRNRLQSGLSLGSVVVESGVTGGSMHQARFTCDQKRRLFTVLAESDETRGDLNEAGARHLIDTLGAVPLRGTRDLARELTMLEVPLPQSEPPQVHMEW